MASSAVLSMKASTVPLNLAVPHKTVKNDETTKSWFGRTVTACSDAIKSIPSYLVNGVKNTNTVSSAVNPLAAIGRKLPYTLKLIEHTVDKPGLYLKLTKAIKLATGSLDAWSILSDVHYFHNGEWKKDGSGAAAGRAAILVANTGGALLWLEQLKFFNLASVAGKIGNAKVFSFVPKVIAAVPVLAKYPTLLKIAKSIGELRIFSLIAKISVNTVAMGALLLGYSMLAADAIYRFVKAANPFAKISAALDASNYVAEIAVGTMAILGASVPVIGIGASICVIMGIASFLYRKNNEDKINEPSVISAKTVAQ